MVTYTHEPIAVYLRQAQYEALQELAAAQGIALDELERQGVDAVLAHAPAALSPTEERLADDGPPDGDPLRDIIGMIDSGDQAEAAWPLDIPIQHHPLWRIVDLGDAGVSDLAEHHDRYLVEILEAESHPWPAKSS